MAKHKAKLINCPVKPTPPGGPNPGPEVVPSVEGQAVFTLFENALDLINDDLLAGPFAVPQGPIGSQAADGAETQTSNALTFTAGSAKIKALKFTDPADIDVGGAEAGSQFTWTSHFNGHLLAGHLGGPGGPIAIVIRMSGPFKIGPGGNLVPSLKVTLTDAFPHDDIQGANQVTISDIHVTAIDKNNNKATADVTVNIVDDVPTAVADTDSIPAAQFGPATGNVITDASAGDLLDGDNGADTPGSDGIVVVGVDDGNTGVDLDSPGSVGVVIQGQFGKLTMQANGSYSYVRDPNTDGGVDDVFTYTIKDGDGDLAHTTLTISIGNAPPEITNLTPGAQGGDVSVDEDDLLSPPAESTGSDSIKESTTQGGDFNISSPDGVASLTVHGVTVVSNGVFQGAPNVVIPTPLGNTLTITGYNAGTGLITYTYTLNDNEAHPNANGQNNVQETFAVVLEDSDGQLANADLVATVIDDVPTAVADTDSIPAAQFGPATGNVITDNDAGDAGDFDAGADTPGADGATVVGVDDGNTGVDLDSPGSVGVVIQGQYGKLTMQANGSYSYVRDPNTDGGVNDVFTYTIKDGDGDLAHTTLTISIGNAPPEITNLTPGAQGGDVSVDEDDLLSPPAESTGSDPIKESTTQGGDFNISSPDGVASLTVHGVTVVSNGVFQGAPNVVIPTPLGNTLTITGYNAGTGLITYTYTLNDNEAHPNANGQNNVQETFAVVLEDSDGQLANADLVATVIDDVPTANDDGPVAVAEDTPINIGVFGNDVFGADGVDTDNNPNVVVTSTNGSKGTVSYNAGTGLFTYTPNLGATGADSFTYTIVDADGDSSTATVTLNIAADSVPEIGTPTNLVVDEDGLANATVDAARPGETNSTESVTQSGTVVVDFGSDVPANLLASIVLVDTGAPLDNQLQSLDGQNVTFALSGGDLVGTVDGGATEVIRIHIVSAVAGPGANDVTYTYSATLSEPIKHSGAGEDTDILSGVTFQVTDSEGDPQTGNFNVTVVDDQPFAQDDTKTIDEGAQIKSDVVLTIDRSGSMAGIFQDVKDAVEVLFNSGSVNSVFLVSFSSDATYHAGPVGGWFTDLNAAFAIIDAFIADGATDYDAALAAITGNFTAPPPGGNKLVSMYLSDGEPNESNGTGSNGIDEDDTDGNPAPGGEETDWINFLTTNGFDESLAFGFGGLGTEDVAELEPIAWTGVGETADNPFDADSDASAANDPNVIIVTDINDLADALTGSIGASASGNVLLGNDNAVGGGDDNSFGADGGRILSIQVGAIVYTYDPATNDITPSGGPAVPQNTAVLSVTTPDGGTLEFNFSTGAWEYDVDPNGVNANTTETFTYVIVDNDGDQSSADLEINIINQPEAPTVTAVTVSATQIGFTITDPDSVSFDLVNAPAAFDTAFGNPPLVLGANLITATQQVAALSGTLQVTDGALSDDVIGLYLGTAANNLGVTAPLASAPNAMYGFGGDDNLTGGTAGDFLFGGIGTDTLNGGNGNDTYFFGLTDGADTINETGGTDHIVIETNGAVLTAFNISDSATDDDEGNLVITYNANTITVTNHYDTDNSGFQLETISFDGGSFAGYALGSGSYTISVDQGGTNDEGAGLHVIGGDADGTTLDSGAGNDLLFGNNGDDTLDGGADSDLLVGGAGIDTFIFDDGDSTSLATADVIADFEGANAVGGDVINLENIDTNPGGGDDDFVFGGSSATILAQDTIYFTFDGGNNRTIVQASLDADLTTAEFVLILNGNHTLAAGDFIDL